MKPGEKKAILNYIKTPRLFSIFLPYQSDNHFEKRGFNYIQGQKGLHHHSNV